MVEIDSVMLLCVINILIIAKKVNVGMKVVINTYDAI